MKIRIKGNSLRYRLTRSDVEKFYNNGYLEETTDFGATRFAYALQRCYDDQLSARFENDKITMLMPDAMLNEWANTDRVGFENTDSKVYLLVEKDFVCLDNVLEDQSDNYPNPNMEKC